MTAGRPTINYTHLHRIAENLRDRHNLDRPWRDLTHQDQEDWLAEAKRLLHGTGIEVRGA